MKNQRVIPVSEWYVKSKIIYSAIGYDDTLYRAICVFGEQIEDIIYDCGWSLYDLGFDELDNVKNGINVWEGYLDEGAKGDFKVRGKIRELTEDEWACVKAGLCPWVKGK